jgi:type IV secretory pathway protease TraF
MKVGNGKKVRALSTRNYTGPKECDVHLADDAFFVLGDYEENSLDSRILGPLPLSNLAGHLVFRR